MGFVEEDRRMEMALFRYRVIAPLVEPGLKEEEKRAIRREILAREYDIPYSRRTRIAPRTLREWVKAYREKGFKGLMDKPRKDKGASRVLSPALVEKAIACKKDLPQRTVEQVITILEATGAAPPGHIRPSTLARVFKEKEVTTRHLKNQLGKTFKRYQHSRRNSLWQSDLMYGPYLPDPEDPEEKKRTYLISFLDDYSRHVYGAFYWEERLPSLEDCLKKAILRRGLPDRLYVDNGRIYCARQFERICAELNIRPLHQAPYQPQGKGKQERFFKTVRSAFLPEIQALKPATLQELNELFWAWLEEGYHHQVHSETGETPAERFAKGPGELRFAPPETIYEVFLWQEERKVDRACCVSLFGNTYEVDPALAGKKVVLRFDPFDLETIRVYYKEKRYPDARPLDLNVKREKRAEQMPDPEQGLMYSYLMALKERHEDRLRRSLGGTQFSRLFPNIANQKDEGDDRV